ncbi:hypothetical protein [Vibrio caribbeanicus]|uniref:hypothetical protein n=1 Tax=Vibrio caribbeanicus TaxID=701175 RepID=UPI002284361E|nr:hypothetical protein [Vibrio caribbeanicus]MCY9843818.1 hypothetical protein [Vibrio caribbeanicus]
MRTVTFSELSELNYNLEWLNPNWFEVTKVEDQYNTFGYGYATLCSECGIEIEFSYLISGSGPNYEDAFSYNMFLSGSDNKDLHIVLDGAKLINNDGSEIQSEEDFKQLCKVVLEDHIVWQRYVIGCLPDEKTDMDEFDGCSIPNAANESSLVTYFKYKLSDIVNSLFSRNHISYNNRPKSYCIESPFPFSLRNSLVIYSMGSESDIPGKSYPSISVHNYNKIKRGFLSDGAPHLTILYSEDMRHELSQWLEAQSQFGGEGVKTVREVMDWFEGEVRGGKHCFMYQLEPREFAGNSYVWAKHAAKREYKKKK